MSRIFHMTTVDLTMPLFHTAKPAKAVAIAPAPL
jgi:hypothetical protein